MVKKVVKAGTLFLLSLAISVPFVYLVSFDWNNLQTLSLAQSINELGFSALLIRKRRFLARCLVTAAVLSVGLSNMGKISNDSKRVRERLFLALVFAAMATCYSIYTGIGTAMSEWMDRFAVLIPIQFAAFFFLGFFAIVFCERVYSLFLCRRSTFHTEAIVSWIKRHADVLLSSMGVGLLSYAWMMTNKIVGCDDIYFLFEKGVDASSGRWGLILLDLILPSYSMPWLWGILILVLLSVSVCMISDLFNIENRFCRCLLGGLLVSFPPEIETMFYMFTAPSYAVAFCLGVAAVVLVSKGSSSKEKLPAYILGIVAQILALSIYQAYISLSACLLLLLLVQDILEGKDSMTVFRKGMKSLMFLAVSLGCYYTLNKAVLMLMRTEYNWYAASMMDGDLNIIQRIDVAFQHFFDTLAHGKYGIIRSPLLRGIHLLSIGAAFFYGLKQTIHRGCKRNIFWFLLIMLILFPLAINALVLGLGSEGWDRMRTEYAYIALYVFVVVVMDHWIKTAGEQVVHKIVLFPMCLIMFSNVLLSNEMGLRQYLEYENTYAALGSVITQLSSTEGYTAEKKLAIVGMSDYSKILYERFPIAYQSFDGLVNLKNEDAKDRFILYFLGFDTEFATEEEIKAIRSDPKFLDMPSYPDNGYIEIWDEYAVVKLSE